MTTRISRAAILAAAFAFAAVTPAAADKIKNPEATFDGLDKITGRIKSFEVAVDETVQFGALQITPRVCFTRPPTEGPQTTAFIEVDEVGLDNKYRRIFSGWMFAASPGLHAVEHAVYDVWLTGCRGGATVIAEPKEDDQAPVVASRPEPRRGGGEGREQARRAPPERNAAGQIDVAQPRGVPVQPSQAPSRRFFPTNQPQAQQPSTPAPGLQPGVGGFRPDR